MDHQWESEIQHARNDFQIFVVDHVLFGNRIGHGVMPRTIGILPDEPLQYNRDIRPILAEYCFACHGMDSASRKADLRLDIQEEAWDFGAIEPGEPEESELIARIYSDDKSLVMPPPHVKKPMSDDERKLLTRWIAEGANYEDHWALSAPAKPTVPTFPIHRGPKMRLIILSSTSSSQRD